MIESAMQLKDKVRNISKGNSSVAQTYIRIFFMERFLERISKSDYSYNFILKGGMLVSSLIGIDMRATMDADTTIRALTLSEDSIRNTFTEIISIDLNDNVNFEIKSISRIMDEFDYPGMRVMIDGTLDKIKQPIKIDISTDDAITPRAIEYEYKLMFEDRSIIL